MKEEEISVATTLPNWHDEYDDPGSPLAIRLAVVQEELRRAISRCAKGAVRLVSMCAGQGRDVIGALDGHPRQADVSAVLIEIGPENAESARRLAAAARLVNVSVVEADASRTDAYAGHVPADILLVCGLFGNISDADIRRTIQHLPHLCGPGANVIWTRHLGPRDGSANLTPTIQGWFRDAGFDERSFRWTVQGYGIGAHRLAAPPKPYQAGLQLFTVFRQRR
jgi:hypothetical protein